MHLKNYTLHDNYVNLFLTDGTVRIIYLHPRSGTVFYRYKIGSLSDVKHPGIYLGFDRAGNKYYMHNHYENGKPAIVTELSFTQGQPIYEYENVASNTPQEIVKIGLDQIMVGEAYMWLNYNCQTFVNRARFNKSKSEDVEKWAGGLLISTLVILGIRVFNKQT